MLEGIGGNSIRTQESNRSVILSILMDGKIHTRAEIAVRMDLTQAAISKIIAELEEYDLIREVGIVIGKKGRKSFGITINENFCKVLAVKISRHYYKIGVKTWTCQSIEEIEEKLDVLAGPEKALINIKASISALLEKYNDVKAMGVAVPGPYVRGRGRIALMSEFVGWERINIAHELESAFDLPIIIEHDADAGALAEWNVANIDKKTGVLVHVIASEGIGAGIVDRGRILQGYTMAAGEVGHMSINMNGPKCICGNRGCLEKYTSALSFAKWVAEDLKKHPESSLYGQEVTAEKAFEHMRRGDEFCLHEVKKVGYYFGCGIANIINIFSPNQIVITDIMAGGGAVLLESIKETVRKRVIPAVYEDVNIYCSELKEDPILLGAGMFATEYLTKNPKFIIGT